MSFFDELSRKAEGLANKGRDIADITKLKLQISESEKKLDVLYSKIGRLYVEKAGDNATGSIATLIEELRLTEASIAECQNRIRTLRGVTVCPKCGEELPLDALYCQKCGEKIETAGIQTVSIEE